MENKLVTGTNGYNVTLNWNVTIPKRQIENITITDEIEPASNESNYKTITYIMIGIIGALGNIFVICIMLSSQEARKKIPNILITHQSVIDAVTSVLLILTSTNTYYNKGEHYGTLGQLFCRLWATKVRYVKISFLHQFRITRCQLERVLRD